jgi:hypothetical protein
LLHLEFPLRETPLSPDWLFRTWRDSRCVLPGRFIFPFCRFRLFSRGFILHFVHQVALVGCGGALQGWLL